MVFGARYLYSTARLTANGSQVTSGKRSVYTEAKRVKRSSDTVVLKLQVHQNLLEDLFKLRLLSPTPGVSDSVGL